MTEQKSDRDAISVSIARQPVFDEKSRLWGYEIFCVGGIDTTCDGFPDQSNAAINVESSAYICLQQILQGQKKIILDFSEKSILDKLPYALPPVLAAIKVAEQASHGELVIEALERMKTDGYLIAIRDFTGDPTCEPLHRLADIIAVNVCNKERESLASNVATARKHNALLLASQVQDRELYEVCKGLGFSLFHGAFFKSPHKITVRKLSSNQVLRLKLLQFIENEDLDVAKLAQTIQADATISFRLLAYLNSAAFAFSHKIRSIHQAITLLGWANVKNWLRVLLLTDMSQSKDAQELVLLSAQRGMLLELIARDHDFWGFDPGNLHLLGLFSLLDALIDLSMLEIVAHLPIDNKTKAALCREPNNEYLPLLHLAQCMEEARWADAEAMIQQLNLDGKKVMKAFQSAVSWATELDSLHSGKRANG